MRAGVKLVYFFNLHWLLLSLFVAFLDLVTKCLVISKCVLGEFVFVLPFVNLCYVYNFGVAFSLFSEFGVKQSNILLFFLMFITFILFVVLCCMGSSHSVFFKMGYATVVGGALGNLIDRIRYGVVIDFIDFHVLDWHFPIFNIADLSIFIGVVVMFLYNYK